MAYLNDYELAAIVAEQPVPVWVGIGHERDKVILDEVAHTSFDTPSKVIAAISAHLANLVNQTLHYQAQIKQSAQRLLKSAEQQTIRQLSQVQAQTLGQLTALQKDSNYAWQSIQQSAQRQVNQTARLSIEQQNQIQTAAYQQLTYARTHNSDYRKIILQTAQQQTVQAQRNSTYLRDIILLYQPARVLAQGYVLLTNDTENQTLTSSAQLYPEQTIKIALKDGKATARILDVEQATADSL